MLVTSVDNDKVKEWQKLSHKKYRDELGLFIVEGKNLVTEAFKSGFLGELIVLEDETFKLDINTTYVNLKVMKKITSLDNPSSVIGICKIKENNIIGNKVLIMDNIQDPGNLGTIIRSAVAFNIDTIILSDETVDIYNPKVIRGTQGMLFEINIIRSNLLKKIPKLKKDGYLIIGTDVLRGKDLTEVKIASKYALVMGNEGNGISNEVKALCDDFIKININSKCESLNVAVACSIIIYQLNK
ncbi:MAG: RNA methyltransferase [Bacilli bacterium]|nr:RNA methyltransferase [Bacilli bacterium]